MAKRNGDYDTIIVGGGPAGATTATVLAQKGRRVLLLEREPFPRYHIGESLMPYTWFSFERLGVLDWFKRSACPRKYSVQFISTTGKTSKPFYFYQTIDHEMRGHLAGLAKRVRQDDARERPAEGSRRSPWGRGA